MHILFGDEPDREQGGRAQFFIYGAIFMPLNRAADLHRAVGRIRRRNGFRASDSLKFSGRTLPEWVSREAHREAKRQVLHAAADVGVQFCART